MRPAAAQRPDMQGTHTHTKGVCVASVASCCFECRLLPCLGAERLSPRDAVATAVHGQHLSVQILYIYHMQHCPCSQAQAPHHIYSLVRRCSADDVNLLSTICVSASQCTDRLGRQTTAGCQRPQHPCMPEAVGRAVYRRARVLWQGCRTLASLC